MKQFILENKKIITGVTVFLVIAVITMSFQNEPFGPLDKLDTLTDVQDTIPAKEENDPSKMNIQDFDQLMQNMDKEMIKMHTEIGKIDFDKMHKEITSSLSKVDFAKMQMGIDKLTKEIDFNKIEKGVQSALKSIDWNKINNDVKISLLDANREIEKINIEAIKKELEKAKLEIEKSRNEIKKIKLDEIMKNANAAIAKAKSELRLTKEMFNEMEKDGLINQKEGFNIEYKDRTLFINGKKQSEAVTQKYQQYIKGDSFKIKISK